MMGLTLLKIITWPDNVPLWNDDRLKHGEERQSATGVRPVAVDPNFPDPLTELEHGVFVTEFWSETRTLDSADVRRTAAELEVEVASSGTKITARLRREIRTDAEDIVRKRSGGSRLKVVRVFFDLNRQLAMLCTSSQSAISSLIETMHARLGIELGLLRPWIQEKVKSVRDAEQLRLGPLDSAAGAEFLEWMLGCGRAVLEPVKGTATLIRDGIRISVSGEDINRELDLTPDPDPDTGVVADSWLIQANLVVDPSMNPVRFKACSWGIDITPPGGEGHWKERQLDQYAHALSVWQWFDNLWRDYRKDIDSAPSRTQTDEHKTVIFHATPRRDLVEALEVAWAELNRELGDLLVVACCDTSKTGDVLTTDEFEPLTRELAARLEPWRVRAMRLAIDGVEHDL